MALFLVQHGISASKDIDPEKGLTNQGRVETERIAQVAKGYMIKVEKIVHSGKKRAGQTATVYLSRCPVHKNSSGNNLRYKSFG